MGFNVVTGSNDRLAEQGRRLEASLNHRLGGEDAEDDGAALAGAGTAGLAGKARRDIPELVTAMSEELRTPLNGVLLLARLLSDNGGGNLSSRQVDYAQAIYSAATHMAALIDEIVAWAKSESGTAAEVDRVRSFDLGSDLAQTFRHLARDTNVTLEDAGQADGPPAGIPSDAQGQNQALGMLLSTARDAIARQEAARAKHEAGSRALAGSQPYHGPKTRRPDDGVVLIVDGNAQLASTLLGLVERNGYQGEVVPDLDKLRSLLRERKPDAVILGMSLADSDGWTVLGMLRRDPETRRLPISMIGAVGGIHTCLQLNGIAAAGPGLDGAAAPPPRETIASLVAVAGHDVSNLLVVDGAASRRADAWQVPGIRTAVLGSGAQAVGALRGGAFDGLIVGGALLDMTAIEFMKIVMALELPTDLPVALGGVVDEADGGATELAILKRGGELQELLLETTLFLHRATGFHPAAGRGKPASRRRASLELAGKKALLVDDDIRSIYAVTGALEQQGMLVLHAESAADWLEVLRSNPDTAIILIDPGAAQLDGNDIIGAIRGIRAVDSMPIIALTSSATEGHDQACLAAGASDTIEKPVNTEQLLSLLQAWLIDAR